MASQRLTPHEYWCAARDAVQHVKRNLTFGSSNNLGEAFQSFGAFSMAISGVRQIHAHKTAVIPQLKAMAPAAKSLSQDKKNLLMIEVWSRNALAISSGNCAFQAAVAFTYLRDRAVFPLEYVQHAEGDHAFLILGRPGNTKIDQFASWRQQAVVCDPWKSLADSAQAVFDGPQSRKVEVLTRLDSRLSFMPSAAQPAAAH